MNLDPRNIPTHETYNTKEFKERLEEEGLYLVTMKMNTMEAIK